MNEIANNFILTGDTFMSVLYVRQPGFTYSADHLQKDKKRSQKIKEAEDSPYIYQNELDNACSQHDMAYGDFKCLTRRTASDKILCNKAFNIAKTTKYDGYQRGLASMLYNFFDKTTSVSGIKMRMCLRNKKYSHLL